MKVGSLFAEIGFKVDDKGLKKFSEAMDSFQKSVKAGLNDLKQYAKAAREISKAMREAYTPSRSDQTARYKAQTELIRAQARLANTRNALLPEQTRIRASNAQSRAKQVEMKEKGLIGTHNGKASRMLSRAVSIVGGLASGSMATVFGGLFGPFGAIIGKLADTIVSAIWRATAWLSRSIVAGMKFGMAYRDYRNFTGRSTTGLSGLMAGTFNTANMRPEDILKDALGLETGFWEMMLGGGNPAAYQLLGVRPTGVGEIDLQNIIGSIREQTGNFENRGLARTLFKMFGLSEDYLNVEMYRAGQKKAIFEKEINSLLANAEAFEQTNQALKEFEWLWDKFKADILVEFAKSDAFQKLRDALIELAKKLPEIVEAFGTLFDVIGAFCGWIKRNFPSLFDDAPQEGWKRSYERYKYNVSHGDSEFWAALKELVFNPSDFVESIEKAAYGTTVSEMNANISNSYYVNSPQEAVTISDGVNQSIRRNFGREVNSATEMQGTY